MIDSGHERSHDALRERTYGRRTAVRPSHYVTSRLVTSCHVSSRHVTSLPAIGGYPSSTHSSSQCIMRLLDRHLRNKSPFIIDRNLCAMPPPHPMFRHLRKKRPFIIDRLLCAMPPAPHVQCCCELERMQFTKSGVYFAAAIPSPDVHQL